MEITKVDVTRVENVIRAMKRGKFELEGEEILAFAQSFHWLGDILTRMQAALVTTPPLAPASSVVSRVEKKGKTK